MIWINDGFKPLWSFIILIHIALFLILALPKCRLSLKFPAVHIDNADLLKNVRHVWTNGGVHRENLNECMRLSGQWSVPHSISCICGDSGKQNKKQAGDVHHTGSKGALYFRSVTTSVTFYTGTKQLLNPSMLMQSTTHKIENTSFLSFGKPEIFR